MHCNGDLSSGDQRVHNCVHPDTLVGGLVSSLGPILQEVMLILGYMEGEATLLSRISAKQGWAKEKQYSGASMGA